MIVMILMIVMKVGVCCFMSSCIIIICLNNIEEMWDAECTSDIEEFEGESPPSLPEHNTGNLLSIPKSLCTWIIIVFLSHFQVMFYLSNKAMDILLKCISAFFFIVARIIIKCMP